jgi:N-glycosylase/DNA lyase
LYGSKLEKVITKLLEILNADKEAKALVFSAWAEVCLAIIMLYY